jgi:DNA-binding NarL/FixJ family response regulator
MMRVVLVDDHRVFLDSFRIALQEEPSIEVVGQTSTGRDAQQLALSLNPDLMIIDLMLGDTDAVKVIRDLRAQDLATKVLVLSVHDDSLFVRDAFEAGAQGYALKEQPLAEVIQAMHAVDRGERYLAPALGPLPDPSPRGVRRPGQPARDRLSHREREIFGLIVQGRSSRDIAKTLSISLKTVETHRAHINKKLGVRSPAELIRVAALQGLVVAETKVHGSA